MRALVELIRGPLHHESGVRGSYPGRVSPARVASVLLPALIVIAALGFSPNCALAALVSESGADGPTGGRTLVPLTAAFGAVNTLNLTEGDAPLRASAESGAVPAFARELERSESEEPGLRIDMASGLAETVRAVHVPVPAALWLFGSGVGLLGAAGSRRLAAWRRRNRERGNAVAPVGRRGDIVKGANLDSASGPGSNRTSDCPPPSRRRLNRVGKRSIANGSPGRPVESALEDAPFDRLLSTNPELSPLVMGRSMGRRCAKLGKKAIVVEDGERIAFCIGAEQSTKLLAELSLANYWNPRQGRQPKYSWLSYPAGEPGTLARLASLALSIHAPTRAQCHSIPDAGFRPGSHAYSSDDVRTTLNL